MTTIYFKAASLFRIFAISYKGNYADTVNDFPTVLLAIYNIEGACFWTFDTHVISLHESKNQVLGVLYTN